MNNNSVILNKLGVANSLQISTIGNISIGDMYPNFELEDGGYFLIKNITDSNITLNVKLANNSTYVDTVFYPGWNVELVTDISMVTKDNALQYGY